MAILWTVDRLPRSRGILPVLGAAFVVAVWAPGCDESPEPVSQISAEDQVVVTLEFLRRSLEQGDVSQGLSGVDPSYLHQGRDRTALELWLTDLGEQGPLQVAMEDLSVVVERDEAGEPVSAQVSYGLTVDRCPLDIPSTVSGEEEGGAGGCERLLRCHTRWSDACGWFTHFSPGVQGWALSGDQSPWGLGLHLVSTVDGLLLDGTVFEPSATLTEVAVQWPGGEGEVALEAVSPSIWQVPVGTTAPDHLSLEGSIPWTLDVHLTDADETSVVAHTIPSVLHSFATDVSPTGESVAPFTFRWSEADDVTGGARVQLRDADGILWTSEVTFAQEMPYTGPTLAPGVSHDLEVHTYDIYGQRAVAVSSLVPLDDTAVAPKPTSVSPSTGPTTGGTEITVLGADFLEGVRVDIGSVSCVGVERVSETEVRCTTPPLDEGPHHVAVINASGAVGLLEEAFYASSL